MHVSSCVGALASFGLHCAIFWPVRFLSRTPPRACHRPFFVVAWQRKKLLWFFCQKSSALFPYAQTSLTDLFCSVLSRTNHSDHFTCFQIWRSGFRDLLSAMPPWFTAFQTVPSAGYQHIPGNWRMPTRCRILYPGFPDISQLFCTFTVTSCLRSPFHLTAPSAVHLIICVSPDSQQRGLSVES